MPSPIYHENMNEIEFSTLAELFSIFMDRDPWDKLTLHMIRFMKAISISCDFMSWEVIIYDEMQKP